jgi:hypothetical protein
MQGYCFASLAMTSLNPSPIICCHCEERSDEATCEVTKTRFNVIQFEVPINTHKRALSGKIYKMTYQITLNF